MAFDADNHPRPAAFSEWVAGGPCPYSGQRIERCINFYERKSPWSDDLLQLRESALTLAQELIRECCVYVEAQP
jgi:hypothetical protein